jgi:hypothetical protein
MGTAQETRNKRIGGNVMLMAQKIEVAGNNAEGYIKSAGYLKGEKGFIIRWNGDAEFNNLEVRNSAIIDSELFAGPLFLSKDTPRPVTRTFNPGATASEISQGLGDYRALSGGQYNDNAIKALKVVAQGTDKSGQSGTIYWYLGNTKVYAVYTNNSEVLLAEQTTESKSWLTVELIPPSYTAIYTPHSTFETTHQKKLQYGIWFIFLAAGFTMKLENLPDSLPAEAGTVWRSGNNLMIT